MLRVLDDIVKRVKPVEVTPMSMIALCRTLAAGLLALRAFAQAPVTVAEYGTGIRHGGSVTCTVGGVSVPVSYSGAQGSYPGLDQVNVPLGAALRGLGEVDVVVTADGKASNAVRIALAP